MPGDTTIVTPAGDSIMMPDSVFHPQLASFSHKTETDNGTAFFLIIFIIVCITALPFLSYRLRRAYRLKQAHKAALETLQANHDQYDESLAAINAYYKSLPSAMRQRFLERVAWFISTKTFTCVGMPLEERMPLFIGAAAVQITFGLDRYLLDFFDTIYIMHHDYNYGPYTQSFEGHVNSNGIYLSWNNFISGYQDYTDADNVGLHEMAHALAYVNFMAGASSGKDDGFIKRFYQFSAVARPIFNEMQNGKTNLLNSYATTNYNEFWAGAVETFFEQSLRMKTAMPGLSSSMCSLLNQDPLLPEKLLTM